MIYNECDMGVFEAIVSLPGKVGVQCGTKAGVAVGLVPTKRVCMCVFIRKRVRERNHMHVNMAARLRQTDLELISFSSRCQKGCINNSYKCGHYSKRMATQNAA